MPKAETRGEDLPIHQQGRLLSATIVLFSLLLLLGVVLGVYSTLRRRRLAAQLAAEDARLRAAVLPQPETPPGSPPLHDTQVRLRSRRVLPRGAAGERGG